MLILIVLLPFFGFVSGCLLGRFLGLGVCYITTYCVFFSFFLSCCLFSQVLTEQSVFKLTMGSWIYFDCIQINWNFCIDSLTAIMLLVVTSISLLVHIYSIEYMLNDPHLTRFMSYLSLFTFFMLILITANNFLQMFVGWEGVGLSSYLLINFWFTRIQANKSAIKAMLVNRVGDFFILIGIFSILFIFNSLDYDIVFSLSSMVQEYKICFLNFSVSAIDIICMLLFFGAMGKSAQLGLHTWLPDAMEGPTPVSALIHAATMVTAGVFLIARCSFLFEFSPLVLSIIMFVGSTTAFFAATTGVFQNDIKKVIAYSTCSQLGYMIFACGLSSYDVAIFHLSNHAFFKALLFLGAGSVIHAVSDEQDMRKMGGLMKILPFSFSIMLIGSLALIGFPFLSGFYSKDTILEVAFSKYTILGHYCYYLGSFAAFFTAFYSTRLLFLVFLAEPNGQKKVIMNASEGSWNLTLPLFILSIMSVSIGYISKEIFIGFGTSFWNSSIFILPINTSIMDIEFVDLFYKILPLLLSFIGVIFGYFFYSYNLLQFFNIKHYSKLFRMVYGFLIKKWYIDRIYNQHISQSSLDFGYTFSYKDMDRGIIEFFGPSGLINCVKTTQLNMKFYQSGNLFHYLFMLFLGIFALIAFFLIFF